MERRRPASTPILQSPWSSSLALRALQDLSFRYRPGDPVSSRDLRNAATLFHKAERRHVTVPEIEWFVGSNPALSPVGEVVVPDHMRKELEQMK